MLFTPPIRTEILLLKTAFKRKEKKSSKS